MSDTRTGPELVAYCDGFDDGYARGRAWKEAPMSDTDLAPAALNRITGVLASRYSAQPTQRDLDVANIAAAAEKARLAPIIRELFGKPTGEAIANALEAGQL